MKKKVLRTIVSEMNEGIVAIDPGGDIVFGNQAAYRLLGVGDDVIDRVTEAETQAAELADQVFRDVLSMRKTVEREVKIADGHKHLFLRFVGKYLEKGGEALVFLTIYDVTNLRRLEAIRRDFVANVSHELKTPLTSIRGYLETLVDGALADEVHRSRFLKRITHNVDRLTQLVNDLLQLARIESHDTELGGESVRLSDLVESVVRDQREAFEAKQLSLEFEPADDDPRVRGEREGLVQIAENLLTNAYKYTPGPGEVSVRVFREESYGVLQVTDSGIGIDPKYHERVFQRFYRVDKARSRAVGGTGLGLSIVKNLVMAMKGHIGLESELGKGSTFTVRLPLAH